MADSVIRLNPFYDKFSKIIKFEGQNKAMMLSPWVKSVNACLRSMEPAMTRRGLLNYYPHCDNLLFTAMYPDAAVPNAPELIRQVPVPVQAELPDNPTLAEYKLFKMTNEPFEKYTAGISEFWFEVMATFDDTIYSHFLSMAGAGDILDITLVQIFTYIKGPAFETKTEENIQFYMDIINAPLDLDKSLLQNFETVEQAHKILLSEAPTRALTNNSLYALVKKKALSNKRLHKSIENYCGSPGVSELNATFEAFKDSIVTDYPKRIQDINDSTAALAFAEDADHHSRRPAAKRFHPLAAAAEVNDAIALAAKATERNISDADWKAFQIFQAAAANTKPLKEGKLCFVHGWQGSHDSTTCKKMATTHTAAQKAFVSIPAGHNLMVDGKKCNVKCAKGFKPAP